jgi:hypothetical protein
MTSTTIDDIQTITIDGETFEITPLDHGGYLITYGDDLVLAATDGVWIPAELVDMDTAEGEAEIRWADRDAAIARIRQTLHM